MDQKRGRSQKRSQKKRSDTEDKKYNATKERKQNSTGKLPALFVQPKTVYIGYGNNAKLIQKYFQNIGWKILDLEGDKFSNSFHLKWVQTLNDIVYQSFKEGQQMVNHIQNIQIIASKSKLVATVRDYESKNKGLSFSSKDFFPETYRIDLTEEKISAEEEKFLQRNGETDAWIMKPVFANCGIGIKICTNTKKLKSEIQRMKQQAALLKQGKSVSSPLFHPGLKKCIIQRYLSNPLLLNGRKFDIRCYVLILSTKPLLVFFNHGYLRLSITEYNNESIDDESKRFIHLTNAAVQKKHPDFQSQKESTIWSMEKFEEYLLSNNQATKERIQLLYHQMKKIFTHMMCCCSSKFSLTRGAFELMGCDILLDDKLNPFLLEMNTNPALFTDTTTQTKVIPAVVHSTLDLVLQVHENPKITDMMIQNSKGLKVGTFEMLYNESTGFIYK